MRRAADLPQGSAREAAQLPAEAPAGV